MDPIIFDRVAKRYRIGVKSDRVGDVLSHWWRRVRRGERIGDDFWALRDVSFSVPKAGALGVIGHNGAGKSTILKLASKIIRPTIGAVHVRGRVAALIELGAGFHPDLTGRENIFLNGSILGMRRREIERQFDSIVAFAELEQFIDTPVKRYSSGMGLRLGFAVAAHLQPEVMLIDEVLSVGDLAFQRKCMRRIQQLRKDGVTILFISHNLSAVEMLCDAAILLCQGREVMRGPVPEVVRRYRDMQLAYERSQVQGGASATGYLGRQELDAELLQGVLTDPTGQAREELQSGDPAQFTIRFVARRPLDHPTMQIVIERVDGVVCHMITSPVELLQNGSAVGEKAVTLAYESLPLGPGSYRINVDLFERSAPVPLDHLEQAAAFVVPSDGPQRGIVQTECRWFRAETSRVGQPGHMTHDT